MYDDVSYISYPSAAPTMAYSSSTATQNTTSIVNPGTTNQQIIGIEVNTTNCASPLSITNLNLNTAGTASLSDFTNAKIWYTGTSSTFATSTQFGSTVATPTNTFNVSGSQQLAMGTNYFWLTYDIPSTANMGNTVDAICNSIIVAGNTEFPAVTNPGGSRLIDNNYCSPNYGNPCTANPITKVVLANINNTTAMRRNNIIYFLF